MPHVNELPNYDWASLFSSSFLLTYKITAVTPMLINPFSPPLSPFCALHNHVVVIERCVAIVGRITLRSSCRLVNTGQLYDEKYR